MWCKCVRFIFFCSFFFHEKTSKLPLPNKHEMNSILCRNSSLLLNSDKYMSFDKREHFMILFFCWAKKRSRQLDFNQDMYIYFNKFHCLLPLPLPKVRFRFTVLYSNKDSIWHRVRERECDCVSVMFMPHLVLNWWRGWMYG